MANHTAQQNRRPAADLGIGRAAAATVAAAVAERADTMTNTTPAAPAAEPVTVPPVTEPEPHDDAAPIPVPSVNSYLVADNIAAVTGICEVLFSPVKNPRTFKPTTPNGNYGRSLVNCALRIGTSQTARTEMFIKASIGARWQSGAKKVTTYVSMPTSGGRFNAAIETDDAATQDAFDQLRSDIRKAGAKYQEERAKAQTTSTRTTMPQDDAEMDAAALGLNIE